MNVLRLNSLPYCVFVAKLNDSNNKLCIDKSKIQETFCVLAVASRNEMCALNF